MQSLTPRQHKAETAKQRLSVPFRHAPAITNLCHISNGSTHRQVHLQRETAGEFEASQTHRIVPTHTDLFALARKKKKMFQMLQTICCVAKLRYWLEEKVSFVPQPNLLV